MEGSGVLNGFRMDCKGGLVEGRGQGLGIAAKVLEVLSGEPVVLVWSVDLKLAFGEPDNEYDLDVYSDSRFTALLDRLHCRIASLDEGKTPLCVRVRTHARGWVNLEERNDYKVDIERLADQDPQVGSWSISVADEWKRKDDYGIETVFPFSYFYDGLPF